MPLFETVKASISTREAAEFYGIEVKPNGKALCPFHDDHHPSMYVDDTHYYCFACLEHGDTVNLVAKLYGLSQSDAVRKLIADFHLDPDKPLSEEAREKLQIQTKAQRLRENETLCFSVLAEYREILLEWKITHAPKMPEDKPDKRFSKACKYLNWVEYHLDLLIVGDSHERTEVVKYLYVVFSVFRYVHTYRETEKRKNLHPTE